MNDALMERCVSGLRLPFVEPLLIMPAKFNVRALYCNKAQSEAISEMHRQGAVFSRTFTFASPSQAAAEDLLRANRLDRESMEMPESKWSVATSRSWENKACGRMYRVVYQWYYSVSFLSPTCQVTDI